MQKIARVHEKTLQELSRASASPPVAIERDPSRPGHRRPRYTLKNPPPHLRGQDKEALAKAYRLSKGTWARIVVQSPFSMIVYNSPEIARIRR